MDHSRESIVNFLALAIVLPGSSRHAMGTILPMLRMIPIAYFGFASALIERSQSAARSGQEQILFSLGRSPYPWPPLG